MEIALSLFIFLVLGSGLGYAAWKYSRTLTLRRAKEEAEEILLETKDVIELQELERKERIQEIEMEMWTKVEADLLKTEERIEELQEKADERKQKADQIYSTEKGKLSEREKEIRDQENSLRSLDQALQKKRDQQKEVVQDFVHKLTEKLQTSKNEIKQKIVIELEEETKKKTLANIEENEIEAKEHAEYRAKRILDVAYDRFARAYCPERGIGAVNFPDARARQMFCDPEGKNIKAVEDACGCDLIVENDMEMIGVAGFDPVRREHTRRTLDRIFREKKQITPDLIKRIAENQKKELFRQIKTDGDNLAKELKLEGLHPEIRQMMGALRYRYSFTQNQYFHCAEVGWLCGLLAAELNLEVRKARRSGMLHDIGKSMDHAMDGGHAVIGANFIQARGEAADIVHNVRAHHYDEQPSADLAFLVIAADAISGARPGARRSTIESYNQKVSELQDIARSFDGVTDCYVLNGGRECRVMVNSRKVDDTGSMDLAHKIAHRIEEECSYPGQIKVVIVRETHISESTMSKSHA